MGLLRVDPGSGLAAALAAIQLRGVCHFDDATQRAQQLPDPDVGTVSVIGVLFEYWTGTAWTLFVGTPGPAGPTGPTGPAGATGPAGPGVATGGTAGQALTKIDGTDYNTQWTTIAAGGGTTILNGAGPPAAGTGNVGDYYADTTNGVLYGPKSAAGYGANQIISTANTPNTGNPYQTQAVRVSFARNGQVTGVRYRRRNTDNATLTFQAWRDSTQAKVAEVTDTRSAATGQFTVSFPTPVIVAAWETWSFAVGATSSNASVITPTQAVTNTADVTFVEYRRDSAFNTYPATVNTTFTFYVEPIYAPLDAWPVTIRQVVPAGGARYG